MPRRNILHLTESLASLGGVETFISQWVRADGDSRAAALLESQHVLANAPGQIGLRPNRFYSLAAIRRRTKNLRLQCGTLICHNFAGLTALSDLIAHERLVVYLHTNSADVWPRLRRLAPFINGCITSGTNLAQEVKKLLGESPVTVASYENPLDDSFFNAPLGKKNRQILIGYAGRLVVEQKRVERLAEFCAALKSRGVDFRLQITGDGPHKAALEKLLAPFPVDFLGVLKRENLAGTFADWDFQIITSDYETGPLTALEGMACGVIPIFPDIRCQVTDLMQGKFGRLLYPVGDMQAAATSLQTLAKLPSLDAESLRSDLRQLVAARSVARHLASANRILEEIHARPSRRKPVHFQSCWQDHLPFAVRCRWSGNSDFLK
jgi:glycosyltransferase involved in cell wall biosynthesis